MTVRPPTRESAMQDMIQLTHRQLIDMASSWRDDPMIRALLYLLEQDLKGLDLQKHQIATQRQLIIGRIAELASEMGALED